MGSLWDNAPVAGHPCQQLLWSSSGIASIALGLPFVHVHHKSILEDGENKPADTPCGRVDEGIMASKHFSYKDQPPRQASFDETDCHSYTILSERALNVGKFDCLVPAVRFCTHLAITPPQATP